MPALFGKTLPELTEFLTTLGEKPYRARQIWDALYKQRITTLEDITTFPAALRTTLASEHTLGLPEITQTATSIDGTERYLMRMADGETVETVWMPNGDLPDDEEETSGIHKPEQTTYRRRHADRNTPLTRLPEQNSTNLRVAEPKVPNLRLAERKVPNPNLRYPERNEAKRSAVEGPAFLRTSTNPESTFSQPALSSSWDQEFRLEETTKYGPQTTDHGPRIPDHRNQGTLATLGYRRATICISSQVGCAVNCQFCLTAKLGIRRDLTAGEIAGQVAAVLNRHRIAIGRDRINLVFMGMGEPFLNYDNVMAAVRLLVEGIGIPASRMTVSTSGIEPAIRRFAAEPVRPNLALSLNASNDTVREAIMPITRKWKIAQLLDAVRAIPMTKRDWVTFEYVLLGNINDQPHHARELLELLETNGKRLKTKTEEQGDKLQTTRSEQRGNEQRCDELLNVTHPSRTQTTGHESQTTDHRQRTTSKINLIVWNPGPGIPYTQPTPEAVETFQRILIEGGIPTYIRRPRGRDIYAACGQLKRTVEPERIPDLVTLNA